MKYSQMIAAAIIFGASAMTSPMSASAATAHNSQAGGFGASSNPGDTTVSSRRVKHAAKHRQPVASSETDRDAGMYVVKPQSTPEYFGHGTGSDGSMPQD